MKYQHLDFTVKCLIIIKYKIKIKSLLESLLGVTNIFSLQDWQIYRILFLGHPGSLRAFNVYIWLCDKINNSKIILFIYGIYSEAFSIFTPLQICKNRKKASLYVVNSDICLDFYHSGKNRGKYHYLHIYMYEQTKNQDCTNFFSSSYEEILKYF